jgi:cobalamin-dependent methionine synthase I
MTDKCSDDIAQLVFDYFINFFNAFRVIDLGVMTPCDKILSTAIKERAGQSIYASSL